MRIIRFISGIILISFVFVSCTIEQNYHFNEDFSGSSETVMDFSLIMSMAPDSTKEEMGEIFEEADITELTEKFESTEGISNHAISENDGKVQMKFDFTSIETLQNFCSSTGDNSIGELSNSNANWSLNGKKLTIDFTPDGDIMKELREDENMKTLDGDNEGLDSMDEMLTFNVKLSFDKKIKKVSSKMGVWDKEKNTVEFSFGIKEMMDEKTDWKIVVKFK